MRASFEWLKHFLCLYFRYFSLPIISFGIQYFLFRYFASLIFASVSFRFASKRNKGTPYLHVNKEGIAVCWKRPIHNGKWTWLSSIFMLPAKKLVFVGLYFHLQMEWVGHCWTVQFLSRHAAESATARCSWLHVKLTESWHLIFGNIVQGAVANLSEIYTV